MNKETKSTNITDTQTQMMNEPITIKKICDAIKMNKDRAPSPDRISESNYKYF